MKIVLPVLTALLMLSCTSLHLGSSPFVFIEDINGLSLTENGKPVYYYRKTPKSLTGEYVCNNYLHPLYTPEGDTLTEEFPADHPFHRGVFWAWHQLFLGEKNLGDGWTNQGISYDVTSLKTKTSKGTATLEAFVLWKSDSLENKKAFIEEHTEITVFSITDEGRKIEFEITLKPLLEGIQIGGSADEKGYGGFSARIRMPDDLGFSSENGKVIPQNLQVDAGDQMTFTGDFGNNGKISSLTIMTSSDNPGYPEKWILRQKGSMQNIVFPGRERINLEKPIVLRYSIFIHEKE